MAMPEQNIQNTDPSSMDLQTQEEDRDSNTSWLSKILMFSKKKGSDDTIITVPNSEMDFQILRVRMEQYLKRIKLQRYHDFLESLASSNSSKTFSNGGIEHAAILMSVLFRNTKKEARVYSI